MDKYIEKLVEEIYRQGWDDAVRHFGIKYKVADLKHMRTEQLREVEVIRFKLRRDLLGES